MTDLEKNIFNTILYFDGFNFPLTQIEIFKYLYYVSNSNKYTFKEVINSLDTSLLLKEKISNLESFYFLKNREDIVLKRKENYKHSYRKYEIAKKFISKLSYFSCFKLIAVVNTLAIDNARDESDIDLFIISKRDRVWTARFIAIIFSKILNLRPKKNNTRNKICLSFYVDSKETNIEKLQKGDDVYMKYWISQIVPIFDAKNYYKLFMESNSWVFKSLRNQFESNIGYKRIIDNSIRRKIFRKISLIFLNSHLEKLLKKLQTIFFSKTIKERLKNNKNNDVYINNGVIKLHTNDRRDIYNGMFLKNSLK